MSSSSTWAFTNFYPRPPRGGRPSRPRSQPTWAAFLSTPSARRATGVHFYKDDYQFISIHALREEGDILQTRKILARDDFYPRPPRGGRPAGRTSFWADLVFLSTPSARRATLYNLDPRPGRMDFYPRPPRGGRLVLLAVRIQIVQFLSTPSARRATTALVWRRQ